MMQDINDHSTEMRAQSSERGKRLSLLAAACIIFLAGSALFSLSGQPEKRVLVQDMRDLPTETIVLKPQKEATQAEAWIQWDGSRRYWRLAGKNFPILSPDKDYEVWIIDPGRGAPVSCGIVKPDTEGRIRANISPKAAVSQMKAFAISIEKAGGDTEPRGIIILAGS